MFNIDNNTNNLNELSMSTAHPVSAMSISQY